MFSRARFAILVAVSGCCASRGHGGAYDECERARTAGPYKPNPAEVAARKRDEEAKAERARLQREKKRREYEAAKPPCADRDAKACWTVALYAMEHQHPLTETLPALEVACDGRTADACFELGRMKSDVPRLATACELGHLRACQVAVAKDPSQAMTFDTRACELQDGVACERVATEHMKRGDRAGTEKYLKLACGWNRKDACRRLGELAVGTP